MLSSIDSRPIVCYDFYMKHFHFLLKPKSVFILILLASALYAHYDIWYAYIFIQGAWFGGFYMMQLKEERNKEMFKLTFVCHYCSTTFQTTVRGGSPYESAAVCACGKAAPLVGVEKCTSTTSPKLYSKEIN